MDYEDFDYAITERFELPGGTEPIRSRTPNEAVAALARRSSGAVQRDPVILKARAFYRVRSQLAAQLGIDARAIGPDTRLLDLLPDERARVRQWEALSQHIALRQMPRLARPGWMERVIAYVVAFSWLGVLLWAAAKFGVDGGQGALTLATPVIFTIVLLTIALRVTRPWRGHIRPATLAVGDLAGFCVAYGSPLLGIDVSTLTRSQVREVVVELLRYEAEIPAVKWDAPWGDQIASAAPAP